MYELTIRLQADSDKCLYEQIYEYIRQEIREGKLLAGEKLPSTRSLAEYLQVARSTVDYAYDQLMSEGYIEARPYRGYYVCTIEDLLALGEEELFSPALTGNEWGEKHAIAAGMEEEYQRKHKVPVRYDFSPNGIDMSAFPFSVWKKISREILTGDNRELFAQGEPQGDYELRQTISRYLHSSRGVNCRPEQVIVGAGNDYLLMLLEKILGRHVRIAMENPTYKRAYRIFQSFAYDIVTVDMDDNGMEVEQLEKEQVTAAYVMPSHQFPTGIVMPVGRRTELLHWARKAENRYLIEDDYDSEFRYRGKPIPALQGADEYGKVIYIGTFSKAIAPAIRVSYMVLPEKLLFKYRQQCYFFSCTVPRVDQRILNVFIRDGYFERHLNKMRKLYRTKHECLLEELRPYETDFTISGEHAGLHLLLHSNRGISEEALVEKALEKEVRVYGLSESMVERSSKGQKEQTIGKATILLGYGALEQEEIREGISLLKDAWFR